MPRLHEFIRNHTEEILVEWETFARTLPVAKSMDVAALRDHAKEMLLVMARDLETAQTAKQASEKSKGKSDASDSGAATAAQEHGAGRADSGFTMAQMLAELRALRASVLRLWGKHAPEVATTDFDDMTRFNEAIDQAIAESALQYSQDLNESKERFLAILGHDLRNPIGAITMSATFMLETGELTEQQRILVSRIANSGRRMSDMVNDLLDFTRTRFGDTIPITPADMDASRLIRDVVTEVTSRYPDTDIEVESAGEVRGNWDYARLTQAVTNLVSNAVQHGDRKSRITVAARATPSEALISVQNTGPVIPEDRLRKIFEPGPNGTGGQNNDEHLGLGLYIVDKIVAAHAGKIDVRSSENDGTVFTIHLPRAA